jgi:hypothetical protein
MHNRVHEQQHTMCYDHHMSTGSGLTTRYDVSLLRHRFMEVMGGMCERTMAGVAPVAEGDTRAFAAAIAMAFDASILVALCDELGLDPCVVIDKAATVLDDIFIEPHPASGHLMSDGDF